MHPAARSRLRLSFRNVLKAPPLVESRVTHSNARLFHQTERVRIRPGVVDGAGESTKKDATDSSLAGNGAEETVARGDAAEHRTSSNVSQEPSSQVNHNTEILGKGGDVPNPSKKTSFYGSAARRRLRSRNPKESTSPEPPPEWFVQHNVYPKGGQSRHGPGRVQIVVQDRKKRYIGVHSNVGSANTRDRPVDQAAAETSKENSEPLFWEQMRPSNIDAIAEREPFPDPDKRYFVDALQTFEIFATAKGLMKLPVVSEVASSEQAVLKSHLLIHYPAHGGEMLLDSVVGRLAQGLDADLVVLDAQDIAELVATSDLSHDVRIDGRLLGYDVYFKSAPLSVDDDGGVIDEDVEEFDDTSSATANSVPDFVSAGIAIGKPFRINLTQLLGSKLQGAFASQRRPPSSRTSIPQSFMSTTQSKAANKHLFASLVESILLAARLRQSPSKFSTKSPLQTSVNAREQSTHRKLVIHVRDIKAVQNVHLGKQFLSELYDQVQRRRTANEQIMIVGTESTSDEYSSYSKSAIEEIQDGEVDEISRTVILTPILPNTDAKLALLEDKRRRTSMINMRHIWEMLRHKNSRALESQPDGFWKNDLLAEVPPLERRPFESHVRSFGYVHRLATLITGMTAERPRPFEISDIFEAAKILSTSDSAKHAWADQEKPRGKIPNIIEDLTTSEESRVAMIRQTGTKYEKRLLGGVIEPKNITTTFNDVHCPVETIDALKTLTTLSLIRPEAFTYGVLASDKIPGLLLYGPPGTGKTLLAKAVAKESGATVLEVSSADLNDMYVGEGEKNVQALFSLAKKLSPCVVFLDEADSIFSARGNSTSRVSHRELLNQFLKEWDGMSNDAGSAFLLVATNRPMDIDDAVLRRLPRRLLVDLPAENDRLEILKIHLREEQLTEDVDLPTLARATPFYSGSDLKNLVVAAALTCVREENDLAIAYTGDSPYQHPQKRTLTRKHFDKALEEISASISEDMSSLRDIKKFDEQFGDKRGRKKKAPKWGFNTAAEADKVLDTVKVRV